MQDVIGVSPVHPALLIVGKVGLAVPAIVLPLRLAGVDLLGVTFPAARIPAALIAVAGWAIVVAALVRLGSVARVGLPPSAAESALRTEGLYAFSRNPIYVGGIFACIASCLYVPHWLNIASTVVTALVHHRIVLSEERFLRGRFGVAFDEYCGHVRRYL